MKQSYLQALLRKGIAAAKAGQREQAHQILMQVIEVDETMPLAWLWLSAVVQNPTDQFICLQNVLRLDPDNQAAQRGLAWLEQRAATRDRSSTAALRTGAPVYSQQAPRPHSQLSRFTKKTKAHRNLDPPRRLPTVTPKRSQPPCPFCHQPVSPSATTCPHCHLPLIVDCPACATRVDVEQSHCPDCGRLMGNYRRKLAYFAGLATAYVEQGRPAQALSCWQLVEAIDPDFPHLAAHLGQAQAAAGRTEAAIATLQKALAQNPGQLAASLTLGKIYGQLHQWQPARLILEQALTVTSDSVQLHFALAETLMEQGVDKKAQSHLEKVIRLDSQHGPTWYRLGQVYEHSRKSRQAIQAYRRAIQNLPPGTIMYRQAQAALKFLDPELPAGLASGWLELFRQMLGPVLICLLVALLDAGLRPWWITGAGWGAVFVGILGTFLWISGANLPHNPAVQLLTGEEGIASVPFRMLLAGFGGFFWLFSLAFFLLPLGQSYPELPQL